MISFRYMGNLVATNIRLPEEDLALYKEIAMAEKKSFSEYVRQSLGETTKNKVYGISKKPKKKKSSVWKDAPIWNISKYRPYSSGIKDGSVHHDKYIYGPDQKNPRNKEKR